MTKFIVTDRRQLEINIRAMADAVVAGKSETLLQHFAQDFTFQGRKRQELAESVAKGAKHFGFGQIQVWNLSIDELDRDKRLAKLSFEVTVRDNDGEYMAKPLHCETGFVLKNERWLLQKLLFYDLAGKTPLQIPLP